MKNIIFVTIVAIIFVSCAPAYTPNVVNAPLFSGRGEAQLSINTGTSGLDVQSGYAITDHIGVVANGSFANRKDSSNYHKHNFIEAGADYYITIGKHGRFEIIAGYGKGNVDAHFKSGIFDSYTKTTFQRAYIQPSIGLVSDVFEMSFSPRMVFVKVKSPLDTLNNYPTDPFIEPTLTLKVGWRYIKFMAQLGFSIPLAPYTYYINEPVIFSFGLAAKIPYKRPETNTIE